MVTIEWRRNHWGRVIAERHVMESEWDDDQRALILALEEYRRLLCPCGCGHLAKISQSRDNKGRFKVYAQVCYAREAISKEASRSLPGEVTEALLFAATLQEDTDAAAGDPDWG